MRVVTAGAMKQIEEASLNFDMTYQRLMENAGSAAAAFIRRTFQLNGLNCMIFCGSGNNGGDGFVAARKLIENGANVLVVLVGGSPRSEEARSMYEKIELMGMPVLSLEENYERVMDILEKADIVVDAIYGTGFRGELDTWTQKACEAVNNAIAAVIALDIPTGLECDTAKAAEGAVKADFTVVFDTLKPVHILQAGKEHCGIIELVAIGIPDEAREGIQGLFGEIKTDAVLKSLPPRDPTSHKGKHGRLLVVAGCSRYRGAAALSTLAALRSGVGYVTLASTKSVCDSVAAKLYEPIYVELPESDVNGIAAENSMPLLRESMREATAILFGCGLGLGPNTEKLLEYFIKNARCPLIIDADGINAVAANINVLSETTVPIILTPHIGEMSRLCGVSAEQIAADTSGVALQFATKHNVYVVLKGHETVVASPESTYLENHTGNAGLAKAGSGDVLAGIVSAFTAQGLAPMDAATAAVHLHGLAADEACAELSKYAMLPSDLPNYLAKILSRHNL